jgi:acetyl esterase/lipase
MIHAKLEINARGQTVPLYTYLLDNTLELNRGRKRPAVLICPGGGYEMTSDREVEPIAVRMNAAGFHAAVLRYSVKPAVFPAALNQAAQATALLRECSGEWHIDPSRIFVMGFSAGGHLAASLGPLWNKGFIETKGRPAETYRPAGLLFAQAMRKQGVPFALHIYQL